MTGSTADPEIGRLRRFLALPSDDRRRFAVALIAVSVARLGVMAVPFRRLRAFTLRVARPRPGSPQPPPGEASRIGWAVESSSRFVPGTRCLTRALAGEALLARRGHPAELRLGVARDPNGAVQAHAWVECYGRVVIGDHDLDRYTELRPVTTP